MHTCCPILTGSIRNHGACAVRYAVDVVNDSRTFRSCRNGSVTSSPIEASFAWRVAQRAALLSNAAFGNDVTDANVDIKPLIAGRGGRGLRRLDTVVATVRLVNKRPVGARALVCVSVEAALVMTCQQVCYDVSTSVL